MPTQSLTEFPIDSRNQVRRLPARAHYDRETIYRIVDEAPICHVGIVEHDGQPVVLPINHARIGDTLVFHGSLASRLMHYLGSGKPVCVTVTLVDELIVTDKSTDTTMNYRSAVLFGRGRMAESEAEKMAALQALTEHVAPGKWAGMIPPSPVEVSATAIAVVEIESASAKVRKG